MGPAAFFADETRQSAVAYEILKLGEAAHHLSEDLRRKHPGVPWSRLVGLRNEIVHEYFRVDPEDLWALCTAELPATEHALRRV